MIIAVKLMFTLATLFYLWGFIMRHRNNGLHRKLMVLGLLSTLGIAVVLVVGVHGFSAGYGPSSWLGDVFGGEIGARRVLLAHRGFSTLTLILIVSQVVTGLWRHPWHGGLGKVVFPMWWISYLSGMAFFE